MAIDKTYTYYYGYEPNTDLFHKFTLTTPLTAEELFKFLANLNAAPRQYGIIYLFSHSDLL